MSSSQHKKGIWRTQAMLGSKPVPAYTSGHWARVLNFVQQNETAIELAQDLEHAHRVICEQGGTRPRGESWIAAVLVVLEARSLKCAGFKVRRVGNSTIKIDTESKEVAS